MEIIATIMRVRSHSRTRTMAVESTCNSYASSITEIEPVQTVKKKFDLYLDILISGSVHAEVLQWTIDILCLVSIALAVFLLDHGQKNKHTEPNAVSPPAATQPASDN